LISACYFDLLGLLFGGYTIIVPSYRIKNLNHLGLVAGMYSELGLGLAQMNDATATSAVFGSAAVMKIYTA
jgi:hypothetical protein